MTARLSKRRRVAVLYQELEPPIINGTRKPKKPGGYRDSGADIAYVLRHKCDVDVVTRNASPDAASDEGWCFPDTEDGLVSAMDRGATHLWANTILFRNHPLQISEKVFQRAQDIRIIGQPSISVELYDDKHLVNEMLRARPGFTLPFGYIAADETSLQHILETSQTKYPVVGKPARGRGSHGVKVCRIQDALVEHARSLFAENLSVIIEQYLAGQEGTVTVMPSSNKRDEYWALPVVVRFNHADGVAPYNGVVAVMENSRVIDQKEYDADPTFSEISRQCVEVAKLLRCTAPIRIDIRRFSDETGSPFALFDVNMKPNMTGPGRPGRENQASLTALAAAGMGWDYSTLLKHILATAQPLSVLRGIKPFFRPDF